jgi:hypothetical protein
MNPHLRKSLGLPDSTPLKFWLRYWDESVSEFTKLDKFDLHLDNPHFLIEDILSEIEYNSFQNSDNRQYFKSTLGKCLKNDTAFAAICRTQCALALKDWDSSPVYIRTLCQEMLQCINEKYVETIIDKLIEIVDGSETLTSSVKRLICKYSDLLISELLAQGISAKDISSFIKEDEAAIDAAGNVIVAGDSFHEFRRDSFSTEEEYHETIESYLKNRNANEYLGNLRKQYLKDSEEGYVLLRLKGVKGKTNFTFQGVHFYSIDSITYIKDSPVLSDIEKPQEDFEFINIAVPVEHKYFNSSLDFALSKATEVLDFLSLDLDATKKISIDRKDISLVIDGHVCGSTHDRTADPSFGELINRIESIDLSNIQEDISGITLKSHSIIAENDLRKISNAVHWYNKAKTAERDEDTLLYSWIAIESLLKTDSDIQEAIIPEHKKRNTLSIIQEICSGIMLHNKFYTYAFNYYSYIIRSTTYHDNYFDIPSNIIAKVNLYRKQRGTMIISQFFNYLQEIQNNVNSEILKYELEELEEFYSSVNKQKGYISEIKNDLLLIYRLRNLISHNATYSRTQTKLYGYKARVLCGNLIQAVRHHCQKYSISVGDALVRLHTDHLQFMANIEERMKTFKGE